MRPATHKRIREWLICVVALGLIIYESVFRPGEPRSWLIILYGTMLGLPGFLQISERGRK